MAIVLLVDDRAENRQTLGTLLAKAGYEVQDAADMLEAIARVRAMPTDVVVSDVRMDADDDGLNLLRTIKSELPQLPVILYSGFPDVDDAVLAIKLGAVDYLQLPVDPDEFLGAIQKAVETRCSPAGALDTKEPPYGIVAATTATRQPPPVWQAGPGKSQRRSRPGR
jgi:DNA-binding NtrC family response regulator